MSVFKLLKFWVIVFFHGVLLIEGMDVVIIGAGISGISAARHLINHGGYNVTILEARPDRYGGRMWTNKQAFPNATGELILLPFCIEHVFTLINLLLLT